MQIRLIWIGLFASQAVSAQLLASGNDVAVGDEDYYSAEAANNGTYHNGKEHLDVQRRDAGRHHGGGETHTQHRPLNRPDHGDSPAHTAHVPNRQHHGQASPANMRHGHAFQPKMGHAGKSRESQVQRNPFGGQERGGQVDRTRSRQHPQHHTAEAHAGQRGHEKHTSKNSAVHDAPGGSAYHPPGRNKQTGIRHGNLHNTHSNHKHDSSGHEHTPAVSKSKNNYSSKDKHSSKNNHTSKINDHSKNNHSSKDKHSSKNNHTSKDKHSSKKNNSSSKDKHSSKNKSTHKTTSSIKKHTTSKDLPGKGLTIPLPTELTKQSDISSWKSLASKKDPGVKITTVQHSITGLGTTVGVPSAMKGKPSMISSWKSWISEQDPGIKITKKS